VIVYGGLVMVQVKPFDRREEKKLLDRWVKTTDFDILPEGVPELEPEEEDEPGLGTE
jgi:hypothetical protein